MDIAAQIRLLNERATDYCSTCGGCRKIRVAATGSKLDFVTCPTCHGTGRPRKFKDNRNKKIFEG